MSAAPTRAISAVKNMNIPQQIKDIKLPELPQAIKDLKLWYKNKIENVFLGFDTKMHLFKIKYAKIETLPN